MNTVISIIIGVILLSVIIIFHELGHFIVAKKNGIKVTEFMLGMGPKIFSFKKGETLYSFRLLLIGGACQMLGEDSDTKEDGSFNSKGPWAKFSTIIAGPLFNFILAFMFAAIIVAILGYDSPTVINVNSGSPAATTVFTNVDDPNDKVTGMQIGDVIDEYNDKSYSLARELTYDFVLDKMTSDPFDIVFIRDGKKYKGTIEPTIFRKYLLGFSYGATDDACKITEVSDDGVMMKEGVRTDDIGLDELARAVDGTVHMGFGGEVHHVRRLELGKHAVELVAVADVDLLELEPAGACDGSQVFDVAGIRELVEHAHGIRSVVDDMPGHCRPDESGSAGHDDAVHDCPEILLSGKAIRSDHGIKRKNIMKDNIFYFMGISSSRVAFRHIPVYIFL